VLRTVLEIISKSTFIIPQFFLFGVGRPYTNKALSGNEMHTLHPRCGAGDLAGWITYMTYVLQTSLRNGCLGHLGENDFYVFGHD